MREAVIEKIYDLAKMNKKVVFIGSDLGHNTLKRLKNDFPDRYFMEGISEQNVIGMAAGLSLEGFIPYILSISTFLTRRCLEQIIIDIGLHRLPVRIIGFGGGLAYAPLGPTHWATDDFAILRAIPNMTILAPCDEFDACSLLEQSLTWENPLYLRMGKGEDDPIFSHLQKFKIGKPVRIKKNGSILIISCGTMTQRAMNAVKLLNEEENIQILHVHTIKPLSRDSIVQAIVDVEHVIALEEHNVVGGLGSAIAEIISEDQDLSSKINFYRVGLPDEILHGYGSQPELLGKYYLDAQGIAQFIKSKCISKVLNVPVHR